LVNFRRLPLLGLAVFFALAVRVQASTPPTGPEGTVEAALLVNPTATPVRPSTNAAIDKGEFLGHVKHLASEEFRGREAGTADQIRAAEYIADEFKRYGLEPYGVPKDGQPTWYQEFSMAQSIGWEAATSLQMLGKHGEKTFAASKDFAPISLGASKCSVEAGLVFAGYGIEAPEYDYNDFKDLPVEGKWVLLLRYEPQAFDPNSKFEGKAHTRHAHFGRKLEQLTKRKAAGVLLVTGLLGLEGKPDALSDGRGPVDPSQKLPFFQLSRAAVDDLLKASGKDIVGLQKAIDADLSCQSFEIKDVKLSGTVELKIDPRSTRNIIARLEGQDPELKKEYVILGAHSDHVGLGRDGSLLGREGLGKIHPGADDNASGTAGLLEIAQYFGSLKPEERPKRSILFMAFSGEEKGLLGAYHYTRHPLVPLKDTSAMLNMDMIGRSEDGRAQVAGLGTGTLLKDLIKKHALQSTLNLHLGSSGEGPSDHAAFYAAGVPVLFFFTGLHPDYHRPSDTWEKIDARTAEKVAMLARNVLTELANHAERPKFTKSSLRGYLGIGLNHMTARETKGYPVGSVQADSPAEKAGLKVGDIIVGINGQKVEQSGDLNMCLIDFGPGDEIEMTFKRGEQIQKAKATLAGRSGGSGKVDVKSAQPKQSEKP